MKTGNLISDRAQQPAPLSVSTAGGWLARRWYYTPKSHRAYSVRQVAPGDRRLLAEFAMSLGQATIDRDLDSVRELSDMVFDRVLAGGSDMAVGFAALEGTGIGDRIIGVAAYAPVGPEAAAFTIAVACTFRDEQVGRILLSTLVRHAKRVGVRRLTGEMLWSNRPMQLLAQSTGFTVEPVAGDRSRRRLVLTLK
ncbi:MAG TPA: GNAT family N-acetyltransferase [Steroidobacteraceae bacterium]|nr:GNAT family N-acetyltransferase [Steroidobacteraceae bacterium]